MIHDDIASNRRVTVVIYALYAASFLVGFTSIVAIIMNYIKRGDVAGTFLESHFRWQIRTFWYTLLWGFLGLITAVAGIGFLIMGGATVWFIYRIARGWLRLNDGLPMYDDSRPAWS